MDNSDLESGSGSGMKKKQKLNDPVDDKHEAVVDSSPQEEEEEEEDEEVVEKHRYRSMAKVAIGNLINPTLENSTITDMVHIVCPTFSLDTSKLQNAILELYREGKEKIKKLLKDAGGKLTLSCEWKVLGDWKWTSEDIVGPILHQDFMVISVYFANEDFKMRKWILAYHPHSPQDMKAKDVYLDSFKNVVKDYEIESKVSTLLVPNNVDLGLDGWIEERGESQINTNVFLIYCCSDVFRLMADDLYKDIRMSWLMDLVRILLGWESDGRLYPTHWTHTLHKLQTAVDMEAKDVFEDDKYDYYDYPSDEEWVRIRTFCKLAGCIYKVGKELFDGEYPTANVYFHLLVELKVMLKDEIKNGDGEYFLSKGMEILERFDKYWSDMFLVLATASVLDPRFKMKYLDFYCSKNSDDEGSKAKTVLDYLRNLYSRYAASDISPLPERAVEPTPRCIFYMFEDEVEEEEEEEKKPNGYGEFAFFQEYLKSEGCSREFPESSELDSYFKEPVLEWSKDLDALDWWRKESSKYPILSRVARDVLSIPVSRGTSNRAYVADKRECPEFIVALEGELLNAMMCGESWPATLIWPSRY
ncbi:zinc finger BED domain-containing protein RICESLEEPER 2-like [Raphanus sativus]|uniref:Zinc finger BED domain-containing protein RICESLEEPER 2-like n=1 Tax=Raphanus sativus TaxID=3726 RepID=A0A9W3CKB7_RAPSA|nr:zinc finger BED domain-containing protein RICESLEEPER 2-like [Raphanus sativus]